ncbi:MAG: UDP-N-acetylmuramoyl-L-alanine--D-glutamate ligase [Clostridia bacterium]|nr:UDP-N-acetylmuramoyl-L-alanine--D-glutamate ligase [Clostridia bacterium]
MNKDKVVVVGMARSGVAAAMLLAGQGKNVVVCDAKSRDELEKQLAPLKDIKNIEYMLADESKNALDGAGTLILSPGVPMTNPLIAEAVSKGIEVISEIELAYRNDKGTLVAITGTNGKTTTTALTGEIFQNAGKLTYVVGNIGLPYTNVVSETMPESVTVCEVSSFQLESVVDYRPKVSAVLNITEDHLNRHGDMKTYIAMKERIFENQRDDDVVVLNYDDEVTRDMSNRAKCRVEWFSRLNKPEHGAFVVAGFIVYGKKDDYRTICNVADVSIPGPHNLENALAATAMAMSAGIPAPVIRHTLRTFKGVEHRMEYVRTLDDVRYINDSKGTNVDSTIKAIQSMTAPTVIILGGSDKHVSMLPLAREVAVGNISHVVLCGATSAVIAKALDEVGYADYENADMDFERAVDMARKAAKPGGNVLLSPACASFDLFRDFEHRGEEFKRIVNGLS